jgi:hypothetical protein
MSKSNKPRHDKKYDQDLGLSTTLLSEAEVMRQYIQIPNSKPVTLGSVSGATFRNWFITLLDQLDNLGEAIRDIAIIRAEMRTMEMDEYSRWYLVNEVRRLHRYQSSGISMFVEPGQDRKVAS